MVSRKDMETKFDLVCTSRGNRLQVLYRIALLKIFARFMAN